MSAEAWLWLAAIGHAGNFLTALLFLLRGRRYPQVMMVALASAGLIVQTVGLYTRGLAQGHCPLGNPMEIIQFVVWSTIVMYLVVGPAFRVSLLGFFTVGLAAMLSVVSLSVPGWDHPYTETPFGLTLLGELHAALALFSYGVFALLAATGVMYLIQSYSLEKKARRPVYSLLPSVLELETIHYRLLFLGVILFSVAFGLGAWGWFFGELNVSGIKLFFALVTWMLYFLVLLLRSRRTLLARRFAWMSLVLFAIALLTLWPVDAFRA